MRQAGRYLPEFREIRKKNHDFINLCFNDDLASQITLQPLKRFDLDAAIIFSDILMVPYALKQDVKFKRDFGPILGKVDTNTIDKIKDVFTNPQVISRNMILKYFDNDFGEIKVVGNPIKFDGEVNDDTAENAPELNEHKDEIMSYFKIKK